MTVIRLPDPDEALREADRSDLEAERKEEPAEERGHGEGSREPGAKGDDEEKDA